VHDLGGCGHRAKLPGQNGVHCEMNAARYIWTVRPPSPSLENNVHFDCSLRDEEARVLSGHLMLSHSAKIAPRSLAGSLRA
jgi:hypothetical protein